MLGVGGWDAPAGRESPPWAPVTPVFPRWTLRLGGPNPVPATQAVGGVFHTNALACGACALPRHAAELAVSGCGAPSLSPSVGVRGRRKLSPIPAGTPATHTFPSEDPAEIAATGPQWRLGDREHQSPGRVKVAGSQSAGAGRALPGPSVHRALLSGAPGPSAAAVTGHPAASHTSRPGRLTPHPPPPSRYRSHPDFWDALRIFGFGRSVPPLLSSRFSFVSEKRAQGLFDCP